MAFEMDVTQSWYSQASRDVLAAGVLRPGETLADISSNWCRSRLISEMEDAYVGVKSAAQDCVDAQTAGPSLEGPGRSRAQRKLDQAKRRLKRLETRRHVIEKYRAVRLYEIAAGLSFRQDRQEMRIYERAKEMLARSKERTAGAGQEANPASSSNSDTTRAGMKRSRRGEEDARERRSAKRREQQFHTQDGDSCTDVENGDGDQTRSGRLDEPAQGPPTGAQGPAALDSDTVEQFKKMDLGRCS
ncbi:hypothetical protein G6O67_006282 [Ophiocordyceps sinensis]|uniref:Uncharacterized protein n=1 Tax=Ophiocordyceps sinensis TaxID=72228 RepID=A0A8H4LW26_9HYPO|nr:hypothetical protein G6O67_006282 [Ophiocordyceps sinensis]